MYKWEKSHIKYEQNLVIKCIYDKIMTTAQLFLCTDYTIYISLACMPWLKLAHHESPAQCWNWKWDKIACVIWSWQNKERRLLFAARQWASQFAFCGSNLLNLDIFVSAPTRDLKLQELKLELNLFLVISHMNFFYFMAIFKNVFFISEQTVITVLLCIMLESKP